MRIQIMLIFMLSINLMLFLTQTSVNHVLEKYAPGQQAIVFYDNQNSLLGSYDEGNNTIPTTIDAPAGTGSISATTGNFFTDTFSTLKNWAVNNPVSKFITAMPNFLGSMALEQELVWALSALWYVLATFLFVSWLRGAV